MEMSFPMLGNVHIITKIYSPDSDKEANIELSIICNHMLERLAIKYKIIPSY